MKKIWIIPLPTIVFLFFAFSGGLNVDNNEAFAETGIYPDTADPVFIQVKKVAPLDGADGYFFGRSVSISEDTAVVGDYAYSAKSGAAYILLRNKGGPDNWGQVAKLTASDNVTGGFLGYSVSISGDTVVVGAYGDDENGYRSGAAYIFYRNQGGSNNWGQVAKLTASDAAAEDYFGWSVSISGDTLVIGAVGKRAAYIFYRNQGAPNNWGLVTKLCASGDNVQIRFGSSVSIGGDTVVIGADGGFGSGAVYIFYRDEGGADTWGLIKGITPIDPRTDMFGYSLSISGDTLVVGEPTLYNAGFAYIFYRNKGGTDNWGQVKKINADEAAVTGSFGYSVSINGDTVVVGAFGDDEKVEDSGSASIFYRDQGGPDNWGQAAKLIASDASEKDYFGISVAINGETVVVGAPGKSHSGNTYVYEYSSSGPQDGWFHLGFNLWASAVLQTPGNDITLKWKETSIADTPGSDRVIGGYFYADPADFDYGNIGNPEVYVKVYVASNGWANITFSHVTVDNITVYSALNYSGAAQQRGTAILKKRLVEHPYTGILGK